MVDRVHNYGGNTKVQVQGIREAKTAATTIIGDVKDLGMGRSVMYVQYGAAAISAGLAVMAPVVVANHQNRPVAITASIGAREVMITIGATSAVKDAYADCFFLVTCGQGSDYSYVVQGNPAWAASSTAAKVILKDQLEVALNTASICSLILNRGKGVLITADSATVTSPFVGVTLISAAASSYCYIGIKGDWPCKVITGTVKGGPVAHGNTASTTGALGPKTLSALETTVGYVTQTAVAAGSALINFI